MGFLMGFELLIELFKSSSSLKLPGSELSLEFLIRAPIPRTVFLQLSRKRNRKIPQVLEPYLVCVFNIIMPLPEILL